MALIKQDASFSFAAGIDTKKDEKQLSSQGLLSLENAVFRKEGMVNKRNGTVSITNNTLNNGNVTNQIDLAKYKDELMSLTTDSAYTYSSSIGKWVKKGEIAPIEIKTSQVLRNNLTQSKIDSIHVSDLNIVISTDPNGTHVTISDIRNNSTIEPYLFINESGGYTRHKLAHIGNTIYIFYVDIETNELKSKKFELADPKNTLKESSVPVIVLEEYGKNYDVHSEYNRVFVVAALEENISLFSFGVDEVPSSTLTYAGEDAPYHLGINSNNHDRLMISYSNEDNTKLIVVNNNAFFTFLPPTNVAETPAAPLKANTAYLGSGKYLVTYEDRSVSPEYNHSLKQVTVSATEPAALINEIKSLCLVSKTFNKNNRSYFIAQYISELQSTYFIVDAISGAVVGKILPSLGGDYLGSALMTQVTRVGKDSFLVSLQVKTQLVTSGDVNKFYSLLGVSSSIISFNDFYESAELGDNLHLASGILKMYDGSNLVEHGFHLYPEHLEFNTASTGGNISNGTYFYTAQYSWMDNKGQIHYSAPSIPIMAELSGGTDTQKVIVKIETLRITDKKNVVVELYRTENNGTNYYKVTDPINLNYNDPTANHITIEDTLSDAELINNELLYTTGGLLENIASSSGSLITTYKNRIFIAGAEDPNKIIYSKIRGEGTPAEFNDNLYIIVPDFGGKITAIKSSSDRLIIFKESAIYYIAGNGPNNLGEQDDFITPTLLNDNLGCTNPASCIATNNAIFFKAVKGIYKISGETGIEYVGARVEKFNDLNITKALDYSLFNELRFLTSNGQALVYNYYFDQWSTFTNYQAQSGIVLNNEFYLIKEDDIVYKETLNTWDDAGSSIKLRVETGFISFSSVQNFQRVYKMMLLGEYKSAHRLKVRLAYDFINAFVEEREINTADFITENIYGDEVYGETSPYGGEKNLYQFTYHLPRQKCQSIKVVIEDITEGGEALSLSSILFKIGIKDGAGKAKEENKY